MQTAFKEWALIVDALGRGEQIIILRKGGIHEKGGFRPEHDQFLLFPTNFHSEKEAFVADVQERLAVLQGSLNPDLVPIRFCAQVVEAHKLHSLEQALKLEGQHIWANQVISGRFEWGREKAIHALAVRVYELSDARSLPMRPAYGGCKSWIEVEESFSPDHARPALADDDFQRKLLAFRKVFQPYLVLASASPRRAALLHQVAEDFEIHSSDAEELHDHSIPAGRLCEINAERKAEAVAQDVPDQIVLGADTLVTRDNKHYGKPKDIEEARAMLMELQGKTHQVITGVCLRQLRQGRTATFHEVTEVSFRPLSRAQIDDYLEKVHVLDKAGAYAIQEHGDLIIERIKGSYSNVVGLPVERLSAELLTFSGQET
ncbi:MAG: DUF1802 family protein [Verrucomicrobiales bacterium]